MLENIRLAFQGVWSHKLRSMLTMLGIIIGIASIISIVSTIQGTNEQIKQNLIGGGNNTVDIELYRADEKIQVSDYEQAPSGVPTITDDILQEIKDVDGVESAAAYYSRSYADSIYYNNNSLQGAQVLGVDNNYFSTTGYVVRTGRTFREEDYKEFHKVVILDQSAATSLFQEESPLGKTIEINKEPFTVIGIAQKLEEFEPTINSFEEYNNYKGNESLGVVYIPSACCGTCIIHRDDDKSRTEKCRYPEWLHECKRRRCKIQSNGCAGTCSTDPEFQCHDEHAADLDRKYFSSGRRYRRYEHHAGIGNRANERNRTEKGDRSQETQHPDAVSDGGGCADKSWRNYRSDRRKYPGTGHP